MYLLVPRRFLRRLGTAHDGDHLAECPLLDEVIMSLHAQRYAHSAVRPIDLAHDLCLDLFILLGKGSQDHIADLQPLYFQLDRHEAMLCLLRVAAHIFDGGKDRGVVGKGKDVATGVGKVS